MEQSQKSVGVYKVTLPTNKVVYLREPKIADNRIAAKMAGSQSKNNFEMAIAIQIEMTKLLIVQINNDKMTHDMKNDLDSILTSTEYTVLSKVVAKLTGGDQGEEVEPQMEMVQL